MPEIRSYRSAAALTLSFVCLLGTDSVDATFGLRSTAQSSAADGSLLVREAEAVPKGRSDGPSRLQPRGLSAGGRFVLFDSDAPNLTSRRRPGSGRSDVYVYDRSSQTTSLVSVSRSGGFPRPRRPSPESSRRFIPESFANSISADGRFVSFTSGAPDIVRNQKTRGIQGGFIRDRRAKRTIQLSGATASVVAPGGRFVVYLRAAPYRGRYAHDLVTRNLRTGVVDRIELRMANGKRYPGEPNDVAQVSPDGRLILLLAAKKQNEQDTDALLVDRLSGIAEIIDPAGAGVYPIGMTADGRSILVSTDDALVPADTNSRHDCYLIDRVSKAAVLVTGDAAGNATRHGISGGCAVSPIGDLVAFTTRAQLVSSDGDRNDDVYLRALSTGELQRVAVRRPGDRFASVDGFSPDGRFLALQALTSLQVRNVAAFVQELRSP